MPLNIRRILVAVADGSATKVTRRAGDLAHLAHAQVELLSVVRPESGIQAVPIAALLQINRAIAQNRQSELEKLAAPLRRRGIKVTCTVVMDDSLTDSIARRLKQAPASLVAIEAHQHRRLSRWLLSQSDYELIRHCPVPLLIVKRAVRAGRRPVLAALDPWHRNDKPASLDARIAEAGRAVAKLLGVALHSVHVYTPLVGFVADAAFAPAAFPVPLPQENAHRATVRRRFKALNARFGIAARLTHLLPGDPTFELPAITRSIGAQMLVIGAISRSALRRLIIGNTAERVLDEVTCDVLVVKPGTGRKGKASATRRRKAP
ncbi:MAG TPA: universal stress protein [Steroidobacteraceae bacterium]|nr:universal stress protein [Steroidobacteraceae bacterium]